MTKKEVGYVTIGNPAFLTGVHFRGELQHVGDVSEQKTKCGPIRAREIGGVRLSDELYGKVEKKVFKILTAHTFLSVLWLTQGKPFAAVKETASLIQYYLLHIF